MLRYIARASRRISRNVILRERPIRRLRLASASPDAATARLLP